MSLRELPPDQQITDRWRHLRYVPLVILVVLVVIATGIGLWARGSQPAPTPEFPDAGEQPAEDRLPDACHRPVPPPTTQPWAASNVAASEAAWASHAEDLATPYVLGEDGWVFWGDIQNNNFSQAIGRRTLSPDELAAWHSYFGTLDDELSAEGIELYIVIAPAKWAIYPEELPEWAQAIRGAGPLDQLMEAGGDLPLVDLRAALQEESEEAQTYSRVNSHWSGFGAYTGWNAIADCIVANQPTVGLEPVPLESVAIVEDKNEYANYDIENEEPDWTEPVFAAPLAPVEISAAGADPVVVAGDRWTTFDDLPATITNDSAASDASVLFAGDSFGVVMSPYLQQAFGDVRMLRHNLDGDPSIRPDIADVALATRPDIVILEITQRHLNLPPIAMTEAGSRRFLPEVQALRALAVAIVVIYHVWPYRLPGGFIGVDVFFVISGYLITAHLMREYEATGSISLSTFWARRIRRLLPAAFVVLAACVVLLFTVLPPVVREETLRQIAAASGYVLNWVLAFDAVDYLAAGNEPTIVQHYWTLSVEEQFYVGWPVLLVLVGLVAARVARRRIAASSLAGWTALAVVVVSLGYSIYLTWFTPSLAFFATTARAWEFAAGALLAAIVVRWPRLIERVRDAGIVRRTSLPTLLGIALIVVASFLLDGDSAFPGYVAAVPVAGALLVILGGQPRGLGVGYVAGWRPVQFLGDISYSVYLWHWPILLTLVILAGRQASIGEGLGVIALTIGLATATKHLVEDPGRRSRLLQRRAPAFALAVAGIVAFIAIWGVTTTVMGQQRVAAQAAVEQAITDTTGCFGAHAMLGGNDCSERFVLSPDVDLNAAANDLAYEDWCLTGLEEDWRSCEIGAEDGAETWALVGDSHAASMVEAFDEYFAEHDVTIVTYLRNGCDGYRSPDGRPALTDEEQRNADCLEWSDRVRAELDTRDDISTVVYLNRTALYASEKRQDGVRLTTDSIVSTWQRVLDSGKRVVVIKDWPVTEGESIPVCLSAQGGAIAPCSVPRDVGMPTDPQDAALDDVDGDVEMIDLTDAFCDASRCYAVIGDVVVYADHNHLTGTYSRTLMPYLGPLLLAG